MLQPGGVIATIDSQRKLVRALGAGIDQTGQIKQADEVPEQPSNEPAPEAGDQPAEDMPADEKSSDDKPAGETDKPDEKTGTTEGPTDEPSTASDGQGDDKPAGDEPPRTVQRPIAECTITRPDQRLAVDVGAVVAGGSGGPKRRSR